MKIKDFSHVSEAFKKLNPALFGLGELVAPKHEPKPGGALEQDVPARQAGPARVGYRVALFICRRRLADGHDNIRHGCKPLVDAIARSLGLDDADPAIVWEYHQLPTAGSPGVLVKIETNHEGSYRM